MKLGSHRALTSPDYGTQPFHWNQTQKRLHMHTKMQQQKKIDKSEKKKCQKGGGG